MNLPTEVIIEIFSYIEDTKLAITNRYLYNIFENNKDLIATNIIKKYFHESKFDKIRNGIKISWNVFNCITNFYDYMADKPDITLLNGKCTTRYISEYDPLSKIQKCLKTQNVSSLTMYITSLEFKWINIIEFLQPVVEILLDNRYEYLKNNLFDDMLTNDYYSRYNYIGHKNNVFLHILYSIDNKSINKYVLDYLVDTYRQMYMYNSRIRFLILHNGAASLSYS